MEREPPLVRQKAREVMYKLANVHDPNADNNNKNNNGVFASEEEAELYAVIKAGLRKIAERCKAPSVGCVEQVFARKLAWEWMDEKVEMRLRKVGGETLDEGAVCAVCLEELVGFAGDGGGGGVKAMECSHMFHGECIKSWLRLGNDCPMCRRPPASNF